MKSFNPREDELSIREIEEVNTKLQAGETIDHVLLQNFSKARVHVLYEQGKDEIDRTFWGAYFWEEEAEYNLKIREDELAQQYDFWWYYYSLAVWTYPVTELSRITSTERITIYEYLERKVKRTTTDDEQRPANKKAEPAIDKGNNKSNKMGSLYDDFDDDGDDLDDGWDKTEFEVTDDAEDDED